MSSPVYLVHGSATDASTWAIQKRALDDVLDLHAPTRPGADGTVVSVEDQARWLREQLDSAGVESAIVVGSSFGSVVGLEMLRQFPERVRGAILIEPPMASSDWQSALPDGFGCLFDATCSLAGGEAAGELFLRIVLGDRIYEKIPDAFRARSAAMWRHIRADSLALGRYRPRYHELRSISAPVHLVGGELSPARYTDTLDALESALPGARRHTFERAGHMLHAERPRAFNKLITEFAAEVG